MEAKKHRCAVGFVERCFGEVCQNRPVMLNLIQHLLMLINTINIDRLRVKPAMTGRLFSMGAREHALFAKQTDMNLSPFTSHFSRKGKRVAFTLAEVLITLGIIGVVAALTLPSVIQNYKKKEYSTRLKRFYSTIQQARMLYNVQNGTSDADWKFPNNNELTEYWNEYFNPYFKNIIATETKTTGLYGLYIYFTDGSNVRIHVGGTVDFEYDVNGENKYPNVRGRDKYVFLLQRDGTFIPYGWTGNINRENLNYPDETPLTTDLNDRDNVQKLCKRNGLFCSQLIFLDSWEFKDDYPYKL